MTAPPFRVRTSWSQEDDQGGTEHMIEVTDVALNADKTGAVYNQGQDFYCVYGPTALDAVLVACAQVHDGTAADYFRGVREDFGLDVPAVA